MSIGPESIDPKAAAVYRRALQALQDVPILVGGAYALNVYSRMSRHTGDFDIFLRQRDVGPAMERLERAGYRTELSFPHWLAKAYRGRVYIDLIFSSGNGICVVDDEWFHHAWTAEVLGMPVKLCPAEEMIWSKAYVMERERYDGADVAHLIRCLGDRMDWERLLRRFDTHWQVLLSYLVLFLFIYPGESSKIPRWVIHQLLENLESLLESPPSNGKVFQGTLLSREQYLVDMQEAGAIDARLQPPAAMTPQEIQAWTDAIRRR